MVASNIGQRLSAAMIGESSTLLGAARTSVDEAVLHVGRGDVAATHAALGAASSSLQSLRTSITAPGSNLVVAPAALEAAFDGPALVTNATRSVATWHDQPTAALIADVDEIRSLVVRSHDAQLAFERQLAAASSAAGW